MKRIILLVILLTGALGLHKAQACTGITLQTTDNLTVTARTIEWAAEPLNAMYVVVPRGQKQRSWLPDGTLHGKSFTAEYGYVGIAVENDEFIMEGINEAGLAAGLFYFPDYGQYMPYKEEDKSMCVSDMQFVAWVLSTCATIDEMIALLPTIRIIGTDPRASTVHWRITELSGRQVVVEVINQQVKVHENPLGVLTNSPEFTWHLTNLNNYVNLASGSIHQRAIGSLDLKAFGGGSGLHGLPGDMTPPSRFVRAAFFQSTAPRLDSPEHTVVQAFHLLNNFDIPVGIQFSNIDLVPDMPSATQITIATDLANQRLYYRTMYNSTIRCIDLHTIDFDRVAFQAEPLENYREEPIETIEIYY
jgi:choloylglycine hydrolase